MSAPASVTTFPTGTVLLDKYRIIGDVGAGGMGVVVCAEHMTLGTTVAMKFLLPAFAELPDAAHRFLREARAATRIQSEHVARVLDVGTLPPDPLTPELEGRPFIVMEFLDGMDLARRLKGGKPIEIHEAIDFVVQAADALAHAHRSGIIHRDVKPANLFLTMREDGSALVKMLDFGISKVAEEAAKENVELTKTTAVMGSALYMSLEQMRSTKSVDHRTDIYALGVTLYELLTRSHPFTAESFSELCVKVSLDPPVPIRDHRPDVPEELADVIARAYARHPEDRWQTAGVFASALAPFAAAETQAKIEAIQRFERMSSGELPLVRSLTPLTNKAVTVGRPRSFDRTMLWTIAGGVAILAAGLGWRLLRSAPVLPPLALREVASARPVESAPFLPASVSVPIPNASVVTPPPTVSAVVPRVPQKPPECRRGEGFFIDPRTGLRKRCP